MKKVIIAILVFSFFFQIAAQFGTILYFTANRSYIAKNLCENISKPKMHCDGQCVLSKMLKKTEQDQENKKAFNSRVLDALIDDQSPFEFLNLVVQLKKEQVAYQPSIFINISNSIFHPPPAV